MPARDGALCVTGLVVHEEFAKNSWTPANPANRSPLPATCGRAHFFESFALNDISQSSAAIPPAPPPPLAPAHQSFAAMRYPGFRAQFVTFILAMMADNI